MDASDNPNLIQSRKWQIVGNWIHSLCGKRNFMMNRSMKTTKNNVILSNNLLTFPSPDISDPIPGIHHQCRLNNQRDENI